MSIEKIIYDLFHLAREEKAKLEIPKSIAPLHEEIWRSIQHDEINTMPKKMSRDATCELMRILNEIDYEKSMPSSVQMDEELKVIMELAKLYE